MGMSEQNQPEKKKNFQHHMAVPGKKGIIYTIARGIFWLYFHLFCFMHCTGREKLNLDAPYIVIANHTSFADPIIAAMLIRRYEVNFLGKIELAKAPVVGKLLMHLHMIPVDRHHSDMEAMRACLRVTKAGGVLGIVGMYVIPDFPAHDVLNAVAVGIVSGLASTGVNQVYKQLVTKGDADVDPGGDY